MTAEKDEFDPLGMSVAGLDAEFPLIQHLCDHADGPHRYVVAIGLSRHDARSALAREIRKCRVMDAGRRTFLLRDFGDEAERCAETMRTYHQAWCRWAVEPTKAEYAVLRRAAENTPPYPRRFGFGSA